MTMKEYIFIFRSSRNPHAHATAEQLQERMNWMGQAMARNQVAEKGNRLSAGQARTVKPGNSIAEGPYTENKEFVNGYMLVRTHSLEEAVELAKTNPILKSGGNIEIRAVLPPGEMDGQ